MADHGSSPGRCWWSQGDSNPRFVRARDASSHLTMAPQEVGRRSSPALRRCYQKSDQTVNREAGVRCGLAFHMPVPYATRCRPLGFNGFDGGLGLLVRTSSMREPPLAAVIVTTFTSSPCSTERTSL